jgi:hypothetical protein
MADSKTFRAITEVHITEEPGKPGDKSKGIRPTPPKVKIIPANSKFKIDPDSDEAQDLLRAGGIELTKDQDEAKNPEEVKVKKAPAKKTATAKQATKAAPAKTAPAKANDGKGTDDDNENLV